jgi:phosphoenolpyruvate carboxylase
MNTKYFSGFDQLVKKKFNVYNSLIQNLGFDMIEKVGILLPMIAQTAENGLKEGMDPLEILDGFFEKHTGITAEQDKIDFMFKVIQYVERQVVLYDSVEDVAFPYIVEEQNSFSINDFFQLLDGKKNWDKIKDKLSTFSARIVLTAHPTQFYTPSVLSIMDQLRDKIEKNDLNEIDLSLHQLGLTSLINSEKPSPFDEATNIIYLLRHVYYDAIGKFYAYVRNNIHDGSFNNPDILKLGFWPGGDRDGNPFVTSETTMQVADELRMNLMKCYYNELKDLSKKLTFREIEPILRDLREELYSAMFERDKVLSYDEIIDPLNQVKELTTHKYFGLYEEQLQGIIDKVHIFKTHFATLDIRQDHSVHLSAITQILIQAGFIEEDLSELTQAQLVDILINKNLKLDPQDFNDELIKDTLINIRQLVDIQKKNGETGCNRYIISNSEDIYSVLFVFALFRWCGWQKESLTFDIIPLFETMIGMNESAMIMQYLFDLPSYMSHLERRERKQTIMLGFSDGTKDGGYLKANWSIINTKESLSKICDQNDIKAIFFDGRGGPPARGGGKSHRFYAAQSPDISNHEIQLTIQGQTITSKYGTEAQFIYNAEQLLTAGLYKSFFGHKNSIDTDSRSLIEQLSEISYEKYISLKKHPLFIPYLEEKSTLKYYANANIGSRPGKRGQKKKLELTDLRAISFVGSWSQLKQNVPGYYGLGTAIKTLIDSGNLEALKDLFHNKPVFKALILNSMMSLSKCNFELTAYIKKDERFRDFWLILYEEYKLSCEMLLLISGYDELMAEEKVSRSSIEIREKIVLPLLIIQQYALQKVALDTDFKSVYEKIITRSLYGNINASRNSA